jgi:hypothetical protein
MLYTWFVGLEAMFPQDARVSEFIQTLRLSGLPPDDMEVVKRITVTPRLVASPLKEIAKEFLAATAGHEGEEMGE